MKKIILLITVLISSVIISPKEKEINEYVLKVNSDFVPHEIKNIYGVGVEHVSSNYYLVLTKNKFEKNMDGNIEILSENTSFQSLVTDYSQEEMYSELWHYTNSDYGVNPFLAWDEIEATNDVIVGVIDTGIDQDHPDLINQLWQKPASETSELVDDGEALPEEEIVNDNNGWNFKAWSNDINDTNGHGTLVSGIISAEWNSVGVLGVSNKSKIMTLKVSGDDGRIYLDSVIKAIDYASSYGVKVMNLSFGSTQENQLLKDKIESTNALFIVAAGNGDENQTPIDIEQTPYYPASFNSDNIISVAATSVDGRLAYFSNYGATSVDIGAPGHNIYTTNNEGSYELAHGTSMAAPFVSGAAALLASISPEIDIMVVKDAILNSARPVQDLNGKVTSGGILDISAAYYNLIYLLGEVNLKGDFNGDMNITTTDLIILRKYLAGIQDIADEYYENADLNYDMEVTMTDLVKLRKHLSGLELIE